MTFPRQPVASGSNIGEARLYLTGAVIFIGGEANSEIEKAAAEAGHRDVREAGERRSGGEGSSDQ